MVVVLAKLLYAPPLPRPGEEIGYVDGADGNGDGGRGQQFGEGGLSGTFSTDTMTNGRKTIRIYLINCDHTYPYVYSSFLTIVAVI